MKVFSVLFLLGFVTSISAQEASKEHTGFTPKLTPQGVTQKKTRPTISEEEREKKKQRDLEERFSELEERFSSSRSPSYEHAKKIFRELNLNSKTTIDCIVCAEERETHVKTYSEEKGVDVSIVRNSASHMQVALDGILNEKILANPHLSKIDPRILANYEVFIDRGVEFAKDLKNTFNQGGWGVRLLGGQGTPGDEVTLTFRRLADGKFLVENRIGTFTQGRHTNMARPILTRYCF